MIEYNNLLIFIILALLFSVAIDVILGELPAKIHPVVIIGMLINYFKKLFIHIKSKISGFLVVICVCFISAIILYIIYFISSINNIILFIIFSLLLSSTFSINMLLKTAIDVKNALDSDIDKARQLVSYLVSRNTNELTQEYIASAAIESLTENITDSYVAVVFYYFIFGTLIIVCPTHDSLFILLLSTVLYRIFNTLDAMLGYKNDELINIGFVPAKIDDILNFIPARISGLFIVLSAYILRFNGENAYNIMRRDARKCPSPNSGYTMATCAGALDIQLIKKDTYILGDKNKKIISDDITKAVKLSQLTIIMFTITILLLFILINVIL